MMQELPIFFSLLWKRKKIFLFAFLLFVAVGIFLPKPAMAACNPANFPAVLGGRSMGETVCPFFNNAGDLFSWFRFTPWSNWYVYPIIWASDFLNLICYYIATGSARLFSEVMYRIMSDNLAITRNAVFLNAWNIMKAWAIMLIDLSLIAAALMIILRLWADKAKQLLPQIIIVALLINFSMVLVGFFIDASNFAMRTLLVGARYSTGTGLVNRVNDAWNAIIWPFDVRAAQGFSNIMLYFSLNLLFDAIYIILAISLLFFSFILIQRYIILAILFVVAPLAFALKIVPMEQGQSLYTSWWTHFLKYCFVGIGAAFFLRLSIQMLESFTWSHIGAGNYNELLPFIIHFSMVIFCLMFGLHLTIKSSGAIINTIMKSAGNVVKGVGIWTGKMAAGGTLLGGKYAIGGAAGGAGGAVGGALGTAAWILSAGRVGGLRSGAALGGSAGLSVVREAKDTTKQIASSVVPIGRYIGSLGDRALEQAGVTQEGTQDLIERGRQKKAVGEARALSENRTRDQIMASVDSVPVTDAAKAQRASDIQIAFEKGWLNDRTSAAKALLAGDAGDEGAAWDKIIGNMSGADAEHILENHLLSGKGREEALKRLAALNQLNRLTNDQLVAAMTEAQGRGADLKDVIGAMDGSAMAHIIQRNLFDPGTRAKIFKAMAEKKQLGLLTMDQQINAMEDAALNGIKPADIVGKMDSATQAEIINNVANLTRFDAETRGKAVDSLMKKDSLYLITDPAIRARSAQEFINSGGDIEDLARKDYHFGENDPARIQRLINSGVAPAAAPAAARNQTLDESLPKMSDDQRRRIDPADLTYDRVKNFTPEWVDKYQFADGPQRAAIRNHRIRLGQEYAMAMRNYNAAVGTNPTLANAEYAKAEKLRKLIRAISRLRP